MTTTKHPDGEAEKLKKQRMIKLIDIQHLPDPKKPIVTVSRQITATTKPAGKENNKDSSNINSNVLEEAAVVKKNKTPLMIDMIKSLDKEALELKLQETKRKLREAYSEADKSKKRRMIQVIDPRDLPNQRAVVKPQKRRPI